MAIPVNHLYMFTVLLIFRNQKKKIKIDEHILVKCANISFPLKDEQSFTHIRHVNDVHK